MALGKNFEDRKKTNKTNHTNEKIDKMESNSTKATDENSNQIIDKLQKELANMQQERKIDLVRNNVVNKACIVSMTDRKGIITYVNDLFCEVSGYSREECIGQNQNMVRHPNMPKAAFKDLWATIGKGNVWRGPVENQCKDGSSYHVDALISPILGDNGKPEGYIGIRYENTKQVEAVRNAESLQMAVNTGWAAIEFDINGNILEANENFVKALGYSNESEIVGKHHSIFCESSYSNSAEYKQFWSDLGAGKVSAGEFKRIRKDGKEVWINASYAPIQDENGIFYKVVKIASDITKMVVDRNNAAAVKGAVDTAWAYIEFYPDGTIIDANENFVKTLGYNSANDLVGNHHRMFCEGAYASSSEYVQFWNDLANGKTQTGEFKRLAKDGSEVWINASYTPVINREGKVVKVIKIANDISQMVEDRANATAVKTAVDTAWASIEFKPDGTIIDANQNFVSTMGYNTFKDLVGQHHRMFCESEYGNSSKYAQFWSELAAGKTQSGEFMRIKKDGGEVWINASYTPVKDAEGNVFKVIKIANNITEMKEVINEINNIVAVASQEGDLSQRLDTSHASGDYKILGNSVNELLNTIGTPLLAVKDLIKELADGNLGAEFTLNAAGDIKDLGDAYNEAVNNLNILIGEITEVSNLVASSSEELLTRSNHMQGTTQEVASAIQQMAEGAHQQAQQTDDASKLVEDTLKVSNEMADKADLINKAAENGQTSSNEGLSTVRKVVENMTEIQSSADVTSQSIDVLSERSEEIARTLNVITDIAAQTNLLALNAAIEAARAGEAGRGFAVVAEEIRKLAEDSRASAVDIQKVVSAVQKDVTQASKSIDTMGLSVKSGNQASKDAEAVFVSIEQLTSETFGLSKEIQISTEEQKGSMNDTVRNIEKIVVISEETAAGTEQIATSSKELNQGMEEVNSTSKQLATAATQLQQGISKFRLK